MFMVKNIEPNLKLISDYLKQQKEYKFMIPEYQRGYSWDITQCDKLWQDIEGFIESQANDPYFFGTIIVDCSEENILSLIDGQQRTTTFLLLLKALLIRIMNAIAEIQEDEESEPLKEGLKANRNKIMGILYKAEAEEIPSMLRDNSKIKNIQLIENKSINELFPWELKKIIEASDYSEAEKEVHKIQRKQKDNKYTNHFRNFKFFYTKLSEKSDSNLNKFAKVFLGKCQIIEIRSWQVEQAITMFNSLNSTGLPLADADIISAKLYSNSKYDKEVFNELWKNINKQVEELNNKKIINIDSVLQQFMYINRAINKEYIKNESVDVTTPGLRRYYTDIRKNLLENPIELCNNFMKISQMWEKIKDYPSVKLLLKFNENAKIFLISYFYRYEVEEISEENTYEIVDCLLRLFALLELVDSGYSSKNFKTFLFSENIRLVDRNVSIEAIKVSFNEHIEKTWKKEHIKDIISEYDKNILVFLNEYLYCKQKGLVFDFKENVNIEHIMPSSGRNIESIQSDANISSKEEFTQLVNKLGNKILLEEEINKSISNEWFKTKKDSSIYKKTGYKDSKYEIAKILTKYVKDTWNKEDIIIATDKVADRIIAFIFEN